MYKVAILGCENSHANSFLDAVINKKIVEDVEFVGVYSDDRAAAEKLHDVFGVAVAEHYDDFVGKVDGIIITARHGDNHYKYAKPYIECGIPMFIDKPITCTEEDAAAFMEDLKAHQVPVCGGSVCVLTDWVQKLKKEVKEQTNGKVLGGFLRAPKLTLEQYGGFFFYSQHLVQVMTAIFGCDPKAVCATERNGVRNCHVRYEDYEISLEFVEDNHLYYAGVSFDKAYEGSTYNLDNCFEREFMSFYQLLCGEPQKQSYEELFAPVYVMNAIDRAVKSGEEEEINL